MLAMAVQSAPDDLREEGLQLSGPGGYKRVEKYLSKVVPEIFNFRTAVEQMGMSPTIEPGRMMATRTRDVRGNAPQGGAKITLQRNVISPKSLGAVEIW